MYFYTYIRGLSRFNSAIFLLILKQQVCILKPRQVELRHRLEIMKNTKQNKTNEEKG